MNEAVNPYKVRIELPGKAPYHVDLTEFFLGGSKETAAKTTSWKGDFRGRPRLASEFADLYGECQIFCVRGLCEG